MIADLKPYPAMKDSGVEWLGDVPEHWEVAAVKRRYAIQLGKMLQDRPSGPDEVEVPYLKAQHVQWFQVRTSEAPKMWASQRDIEQFGVSTGDLLVCEGGEGGRCGLLKEVKGSYIIQNALHRVRSLGRSRNDFLNYAMSSIAATGWFDAINNRATIAHFTGEKFGALAVPLPPLLEQAAIVRFLDYVDRRVRHYIRAKQKLIGLLEEQKQAVIHRAVTRGLDPNVPLKPSGIDWLGDIPEHWEVTRLGRLTTEVGDGLHGTPLYVDESPFHFVNGSNLSNGRVQLTRSTRRVSEDEYEKHKIHLDDATVLLSINGTIGSVACYSGERIILGKSAAYINCGNRLSRRYLFFLLQSPQVVVSLRQQATGTTILNLSLESIRHLPTLLPPETDQAKIISFLERRTSRFDELTQRAERGIHVLREYRTRLIADVVTGKLDVREAAARLPDEPDAEDEKPFEADETIDDADVPLDQEEADQ